MHGQRTAQGGDEDRPKDENGREAEDEQRCPEHHATARTLLQRRVAQSGDVAQEPRYERQHARRREGHEPGEAAMRTAMGRAPEAMVSVTGQAFSTSSMIPRSVAAETTPLTRAATRPSRSRMRVEGGLVGAWRPKARMRTPDSSLRLG